jgi:uncharacterized membrane protein (UPF0127 family)
MMATLTSKTRNLKLFGDLEIATRFFARGKGLLGRSHLGEDQALWIHRCNSIHTMFMAFAIDCVFVDRQLRVKSIRENVVPWRLIPPVWGASSVFEMPAGAVKRLGLQVGEELHVVP